jgi:Fe-S-cluster-containing dehydrogenase component
MLIILDCCMGCHACEIACRQENDLVDETSPRWCRVLTIRPRQVRGELHLDYFPAMCVHCDDPLCIRCCPVEAIVKREDGIVVVDHEKCNGCRLCVSACPYGAMTLNEVTNVAGKCNFCLERLGHGIEPSCVQHCVGGALRYVTREDLEEITKGKHASFIGKVCYASSKWKLVQWREIG